MSGMPKEDLAAVCRFARLPPARVLELLAFIEKHLGYSLVKRKQTDSSTSSEAGER